MTKKIDFNTPDSELKNVRNWDIIEIQGKTLCLIDKWTMTPKIELKKTAKSKGRGLTRDNKIVMYFDPKATQDFGTKLKSKDYSAWRLQRLKGIDSDGNTWTVAIEQPSHKIVSFDGDDPWTTYVAAYREAKTNEPKLGSYKLHNIATEAVSKKIKKIEADESKITIKRDYSDSVQSRTNQLVSFLHNVDWVNEKKVDQLLDFFKDAKGVDMQDVLKQVKSLTKTNRAIAKYAEKHPEEFAW